MMSPSDVKGLQESFNPDATIANVANMWGRIEFDKKAFVKSLIHRWEENDVSIYPSDFSPVTVAGDYTWLSDLDSYFHASVIGVDNRHADDIVDAFYEAIDEIKPSMDCGVTWVEDIATLRRYSGPNSAKVLEMMDVAFTVALDEEVTFDDESIELFDDVYKVVASTLIDDLFNQEFLDSSIRYGLSTSIGHISAYNIIRDDFTPEKEAFFKKHTRAFFDSVKQYFMNEGGVMCIEGYYERYSNYEASLIMAANALPESCKDEVVEAYAVLGDWKKLKEKNGNCLDSCEKPCLGGYSVPNQQPSA